MPPFARTRGRSSSRAEHSSAARSEKSGSPAVHSSSGPAHRGRREGSSRRVSRTAPRSLGLPVPMLSRDVARSTSRHSARRSLSRRRSPGLVRRYSTPSCRFRTAPSSSRGRRIHSRRVRRPMGDRHRLRVPQREGPPSSSSSRFRWVVTSRWRYSLCLRG